MPEEQWSEPEKWAWQEIRAGRIADFNARDGNELNPKVPGGWSEARKLRSDILKEILFREPYRSAIPVEGVRIVGTWFLDPVDLAFGRLNHQLWLDKCRFESAADFRGLRIDGWLSLEGSAFEGSAFAAEPGISLDLNWAEIAGSISMIGAAVTGKLNMNGLQVRHAFLEDVFMKGPNSIFQGVILRGAKIDGVLSLNGATGLGTLSMDGLEVGGSLFLRATVSHRIDLFFGRIGANLDLSGADFSSAEFDLSATRIEGELRLGSGDRPPPKWRHGSRLILRNTHVGAVQDRSDDKTEAWPTEIHLAGFTYGRLGGYGADAGTDMLARDVQWYIGKDDERGPGWLERDPSYNPQPYEYLANVFQAAGEPIKAQAVRYAGRERARREASRERLWRLPLPGWRWLGLTLLKWTIGYGIGLRYFRALGWVLAITFVGAGVLLFSGQPFQGVAEGMPAQLVYSLDQVLPIVEFEKYDKVALQGWVAYYFYAQKLIGWVLGSFLIAGLAGLTQK